MCSGISFNHLGTIFHTWYAMKYRLHTSLLTRNIFCCCRVAGVQSARGGAATRDLNVCSHCSPIIAMIASLLLASPGPGQVFTTLLPPVNISICSAGAPPHIHNSLLSYTRLPVAKLKIIASVHIHSLQHRPSCNSWKCSTYEGNEPNLIVNTLKLVTMNRKLLLKFHAFCLRSRPIYLNVVSHVPC